MASIDKSLDTYRLQLSEALDDVVNMVALTYDGFMKHKKATLQQAEALGRTIHQFEKTFDEAVIKEGDKEGVRLLLALAGHVERIGDCLEAVIRTVHTKVVEGTLFSDKAVAELSSIYTAVRDMARDVKDVVLTGNPVLVEHTVAASEKTSQAARDFATHHQERLISGVCQPKHSSLYLDMVDNLRMVSGHLREMVENIRD